MNSLLELQNRFAAALFDRAVFDPALLDRAGSTEYRYIRDDGLDAGTRLAIYRNNVFSNYREALRAVYPVVERLVGEKFFRQSSDEYIRRYPSTSGDLDDYGAAFADFLAMFPPTRTLAYLPDVARLEWLVDEAFHAANHQPLDVARLAALAEDSCGELRFRLHPACRLFESGYPVARIWQVNQAEWDGDAAVDLHQGGETLLVHREGFAVVVQPLPPGEFAMLNMLAAGRSFADAYDWARDVEAEFDVAAFLRRQIGIGTLVDFELHGDQRDSRA